MSNLRRNRMLQKIDELNSNKFRREGSRLWGFSLQQLGLSEKLLGT